MLAVVCILASAQRAGTAAPPTIPPVWSKVTTLADLSRTAAPPTPGDIRFLDLSGTVCYVDPSTDMLVLHDGASMQAVFVDLRNRPLAVGEGIRLQGTAHVSPVGNGYSLSALGTIDNDRLHTGRQQAATVALHAGLHPLSLDWFNASGDYGLSLEWEGPDISRQPIAATALSRTAVPASPPGLTYQVYGGRWWSLPLSFDPRAEIAQGSVARIELPEIARHDLRAVHFTGYLRVPKEGTYTFYLTSDDGSRLRIGPSSLRLEIEGEMALPRPRMLVPGQTLETANALAWATMEGTATSMTESPNGQTVTLRAGNGEAQITIVTPVAWLPSVLPRARLRVTGVSRSDLSPDQLPVATTLLTSSADQLEVLQVAPEIWQSAPEISVEALSTPRRPSDRAVAVIARIRGVVVRTEPTWFAVRDRTGERRFASRLATSIPTGAGAEVLVAPDPTGAGGAHAICIREISDAESGRPLTLIEQIHELEPADLQKAPAVRISGIVTCSFPEHKSATVQDSSRGIWVDLNACDAAVHVGDFVTIEGNAIAGEFSPFIRASHVTALGAAPLPDPVPAASEQLIDGSLHCQYVEVEGYVSEVHGDVVTLRMRSGRAKIRLEDASVAMLRQTLGAIVRIRGCLFSSWDKQTRRVTVGAVAFDSTSIAYERPAAIDPYAVPHKRVSELLQFDPQQNFFRRVSISGQVLHAGDRLLYLVDGSDGVRVQLTDTSAFHPGDRVTASGFAEFEGATPLLAEAVARKDGTAPLPPADALTDGRLLSESYDSRRVSVEATLTGVTRDGNRWVLELQTGHTRFHAELPANSAAALPRLGSTLSVTGVYAARGGNRAAGTPIESFDLLLNAPSDLRVLANPPWWTLPRLLAFLGVLAAGLAAALLWIWSLHRQVAQKTGELKREIEERQHLEHQRAVEQERTRLANDLHDDLGAGLTEVSMLGALAKTAHLTAQDRDRYLSRVTDTARLLVDALDEIVWAVNPKYDSVASLPAYFSSYAQRFLEAAAIPCRLDIPEDLPDARVTSNVRHHLFLALKETLNNVVRHAGATEVTLRIRATATTLELTVADNGIGADLDVVQPGMDGLGTIKSRLHEIGGTATVASRPGEGTTVTLTLELGATVSQ